MDTVAGGHEAEVNAELGAALLAALRAWVEEATADDGLREPGAKDEDGSDEEVA